MKYLIGSNDPGSFPDAEPEWTETLEQAYWCLKVNVKEAIVTLENLRFDYLGRKPVIELSVRINDAISVLDELEMAEPHEANVMVDGRNYWIRSEESGA